jgi:hypothetical protein
VEPQRILAEDLPGTAELYVALTRATQRLGVLHQGPLPQALTGLAETGTPAQAGITGWRSDSRAAGADPARDRATDAAGTPRRVGRSAHPGDRTEGLEDPR